MFNILLICLICVIYLRLNILERRQAQHTQRITNLEDKLNVKRANFNEFKSYIESTNITRETSSENKVVKLPIKTIEPTLEYDISLYGFRQALGSFTVDDLINNYYKTV